MDGRGGRVDWGRWGILLLFKLMYLFLGARTGDGVTGMDGVALLLDFFCRLFSISILRAVRHYIF